MQQHICMTVMVKVIHVMCCVFISGLLFMWLCAYFCVCLGTSEDKCIVWIPLNPHENWSVYNLTGEFPSAVSNPVIYPSRGGYGMCSHTRSHTVQPLIMKAALLMCAFWFLGHVQGWSVLPRCCWLFRDGMCWNICTANDMGAAFGLATHRIDREAHTCLSVLLFSILSYYDLFNNVLFNAVLLYCSLFWSILN